MSHVRRRTAAVRAAAVAAALVAGNLLATPAAALPATPASSEVPATARTATPQADPAGESDNGGRSIIGSARSDIEHTPVQVTLVTGDRVRLTQGSGSKPSVQYLPADGHPAGYQTRTVNGHLYVYPDLAAGALAADAIDEKLFDITGLVDQGYSDAATDVLPVITSYRTAAAFSRHARSAAPGAEITRSLDSIDATAVAVTKDAAADYWAGATKDLGVAGGTARSAAPVGKIWLDARVSSSLHDSVAQVRAPQAWAAGLDGAGATVAVLDTGVDADHPDLQGRIIGEQDFTDSSNGTGDIAGHGTHVASTVAGTGAASDGEETGVAPGADLLIGKVLGNSGSGSLSGIIAGMEWAVESGADVVSMSLGSTAPTDCTDPMAEAARTLAAQDTSLFVVAAGNIGTAGSVTSPGCVPGVLTVGAVDGEDKTADFSSRGSTIGEHTLKPEIAAPGVGILAAATGGRGLYAYRTMSGTSMATPHVAGAAAILAQQHPDWPAQQLKAALVSSATSKDVGPVTEVGSGRLDVLAATRQTVLGDSAVQAGVFGWPQDPSDADTVPVTYRNTSARPVTLRLSLDTWGNDGSAAPTAMARLRGKSLTIRAGGTATAELQIDPNAKLRPEQYGDIGGRITAVVSDGTSVSTPFTFYVEPETVTLRIKTIDRNGDKAAGSSSLDLTSMDVPSAERRVLAGKDQSFRVRPGQYSIGAFLATPDAGTRYPGSGLGGLLADSISYFGYPQLTVDDDMVLILDARTAHEISTIGERPLQAQSTTVGYGRWWDNWIVSGAMSVDGTVKHVYAGGQGVAANGGGHELDVAYRSYAPRLELRTAGEDSLDIDTVAPGRRGFVLPQLLDGTGSAALLDVGRGTPAELADADGAVVLVHADDSTALAAVAADAAAAGAVAVLGYRTDPGRWRPSSGRTDAPAIPQLTIDSDTASELRQRLSDNDIELQWTAVVDSPYAYHLAFRHTAPITGDVVHRVRDAELSRVTTDWNAMGADGHYYDWAQFAQPWGELLGVGTDEWVRVGTTREEFFSAGDWKRVVDTSFPYGDTMIDPVRTYAAGEHTEQAWFTAIVRPVAPRSSEGTVQLVSERQANQIGFALGGYWGDTEPRHWSPGASFGTIGNAELFTDGQSLGKRGTPSGVWNVPATDSNYVLRVETTKVGNYHPMFQRSLKTTTEFGFSSHEDTEIYSQDIGVMFPGYELDVDGHNNLPATDGQRIGFTLSGHAQYTPGEITDGSFEISDDNGETWTAAPVGHDDTGWFATVDHTGNAGATVSTRVALTDANGNTVTQTVLGAYGVQ